MGRTSRRFASISRNCSARAIGAPACRILRCEPATSSRDGCGLVFGHGDASDLAAALQRLLADPLLYERCRDRAYQQAATYDASRTVHRLASLYRDLVASGAS